MGGDHGPSSAIPGAAAALADRPGLTFLIFGDEARIAPFLEKYPALKAASEIHHTDIAISNHESASAALRRGKGSSMRLAIDAVSKGEADCIVSAGNTGALMATAKMVLKCLPGIHRPAIASVLPTVHGRTIMLDLGANIHCDAENLVQFSVLGSVLARAVFGIDRPSVGILNVGSEDKKGHEILHDAAAVLQNTRFPGAFHGFIEGNDIAAGTVDVVVTDGFTGNVALKTAEGVGKMIGAILKEELGSSLLAKMGYVLSMRALNSAKHRMDPRQYNGGLFLGLSGICIKSHGSADDYAFSRAVLVGANMVENRFNAIVADEIEQLASQEAFVSLPMPLQIQG